MIVTYNCYFGSPLPLNLAGRFGERVEIEALEFVNNIPIEWRLDESDWRPGLLSGVAESLRGFHDLQFPVHGGTRGYPAGNATLHTRGIGDALVLVWLRDGTYSERTIGSNPLQVLQPKTANSKGSQG